MTALFIAALTAWGALCYALWLSEQSARQDAERLLIDANDRADAAEFREKTQRAECDGLRAELAAVRDTTADAVEAWLRSVKP